MVLTPLFDLATRDGYLEEVGIIGDGFGVDLAGIVSEHVRDVTWICRAHYKLIIIDDVNELLKR